MNEISPPHSDNPHRSRFDNATFNSQLSWTARGVYAYLSGHPYRHRFRTAELISNGRIGVDSPWSTRQALMELQTFGYVEIKRGIVQVKNGYY